jgi:glutamine amidotransferase
MDAWGLGFVQGSEVLLQKRPKVEGSSGIDFYGLTRDLHAEAFVARWLANREAPLSTEEIDPFRFRSWLFGGTVRIAHFAQHHEALYSRVPSFMKRGTRGFSESECLGYLVLAEIHAAGLLDSPTPPVAQIGRCLARAVSGLESLLKERGHGSSGDELELAFTITNGRVMAASALSQPLQYLTVEGVSDCPVCQRRHHLEGDKTPRRISHEGLRAVIIESHNQSSGRPGWRPLPDRHTLLVGPDRVPAVAPLLQ